MHWRIKSKIQNFVAFFPDSLSYTFYYLLQRKFGGLKNVSPCSRLRAGYDAVVRLQKTGFSPIDKVFLEIGTGRRINTPLSLWLMGAKEIITVDLNPYLKEELIRDDIAFIVSNESIVRSLLGIFLIEDRLKELLTFIGSKQPYCLDELFEICCINYLSPTDAASLPFPNQSIDFHTSFTVLEHIPPATLKNVFLEGNRVLRTDGAFIHYIDYSDHFSHSDKSISPINFLGFSDEEWNRIAGNRYMYMNRLRHDNFVELLKTVSHNVMLEEPYLDHQLLRTIQEQNIVVHNSFQNRSNEVLATTGAWFVSSPYIHSTIV